MTKEEFEIFISESGLEAFITEPFVADEAFLIVVFEILSVVLFASSNIEWLLAFMVDILLFMPEIFKVPAVAVSRFWERM